MKKEPKAPIETLPIMEAEDLASATECTGLVPAGVQTPEEAQNYAQMYAIHEQKPAWKQETPDQPIPKNED